MVVARKVIEEEIYEVAMVENKCLDQGEVE